MKLSLLIPTIERDADLCRKLLADLRNQISPYKNDIEVLLDTIEADSIGTKRNRLLQDAKGEYQASFDSDDMPAYDYIEWLMKAIESGCDCSSLKGVITFDGKNPEIFEHSLKYDRWATNTDDKEVKYIRTPNHLNMVRTDIARQIGFPEKNHGEDADYSHRLYASGFLKKEFYIEPVIYYYRYRTIK